MQENPSSGWLKTQITYGMTNIDLQVGMAV